MNSQNTSREDISDRLRDALEAFPGDDVMDASCADGFLTAAAIMPGTEKNEKLFAAAFSLDPEFVPGNKEKEVFPLLEERFEQIDVALKAGHGFEPIIFPFVNDKEEPLLNAEGIPALALWATGFYLGLSQYGEGEDVDDELLAPVLRHLDPEDFEEKDREEVKALVEHFAGLHKPLKDFIEAMQELVRGVYGLKKALSPNVPVAHESPKIGRNDPCPCGSGKKYKKCCGAK